MDTMRSFVMTAWNNRWPPAKFSLQCRKQLVGKHSADTLTDILLKEAFVGSSCNSLLLSYLQHLLTSQEISFESVLIVSSQFDDVNRPLVLLNLILFLKKNKALYFHDLRSKDIIPYCELILGHISWLYTIMSKAMIKMSESDRADQHYISLLSSCCDIITSITQKSSLQLLLRLSQRFTQTECFHRLNECGEHLKSLLPYLSDLRPDLVQRIVSGVKACNLSDPGEKTEDGSRLFLLTSPSASIGSLVTMEALGNPAEDAQSIIKLLKLYKALQNLDGTSVVTEILRSSISGLSECEGIEQTYWISFVLIKLPLLLSRISSSNHQIVSNADIAAAFDRLLGFDALLDRAEFNLKEPDLLSLLFKEMARYSLLPPSKESSLIERRKSQRQICVAYESQSAAAELLNVYDHLDNIMSNINSVNSSADIVTCGRFMIDTLSNLTSSEKLLNTVLISSACGRKLNKLVMNLIRLNELSTQSSHNELGMELCDLTLLMLMQACVLLSWPVFSKLIPDSYSSFVFVSQFCHFLRTSTLPNLAGNTDSLNEIMNRIDNKQRIIESVRFLHLVRCLPTVFIELSKAWHLSAVEESTVRSVIGEIASISHSLLLHPAIALISQAKLCCQQLREKQMNIVMFIANVTTSKTNRDSLLKSIITKLVFNSGLSDKAREERFEVTCNETIMSSVAKSIEDVIKKGYISTTTYKFLEKNLKLADIKWFIQWSVSRIIKYSYVEDLSKTTTLLHMTSLFSLPDIINALIYDCLPDLLHKAVKPISPAEPKTQAICQLIAWNIATFLAIDQDKNLPTVRQLMNHVYNLASSLDRLEGDGAAAYILKSLIHNILELGRQHSSLILSNIPVKLISLLLPTKHRLVEIVLQRSDLTTDDINTICKSVLYQRPQHLEIDNRS